jgi:uncharacterized protein YceK
MTSRNCGTAAVLPVVLIALSGCVSVFEGTSQEIKVATNPSGATCDFVREGKSIGAIAKTPGTLVVRKSKFDITIKCSKLGYQEASYLDHSGTTDTIAANVVVDLLLTAGISSIVDSANGADNWYEPAVNITMIQNVAVAGSTTAPGLSDEQSAVSPPSNDATAKPTSSADPASKSASTTP